MRTGFLLRSAGVIAIASAAIAGACSRHADSDEDVATAPVADEPWIVPAEMARVVGGDDQGWVIDQEGRLWLVDNDGDVAATDVDLSSLLISFATSYRGDLVIGGQRCDGGLEGEGCPGEVVTELWIVDATGDTAATIEVAREVDEWRSSGGARLLGPLEPNGDLLISRSQGWVELTPDGTVNDSDITAPSNTLSLCMVDGTPAILRDNNATPPDDDMLTDSRNASEPEIPDTTTSYDWTVDLWDGASWSPGDNANHRGAGEPAVAECVSDGFVISTTGLDGHEAVAIWTPREGWQDPPQDYRNIDFDSRYSDDLYLTDLDTAFILRDGTIAELDHSEDEPLAVVFTDDIVDLDSADHIEIDDSGTVLFACQQLDGITQCAISPSN